MSFNISVGTPTANSYSNVASANTYFRELEAGAKWNDIASTGTLSTTARKENLLKQATREIDNTFRFHSSKYNLGDIGADNYQNLEFPRSSNLDADSNLYIPAEIKYATYEQANWVMGRGTERYDNDGTLVSASMFSKTGYNFLKGWVNRGIKSFGSYNSKYSW